MTDAATTAESSPPGGGPLGASAVPAAPRFVGGPPRSRIVPLTWPVEYDGRVYNAITVHRLSAGDVGDVMRAIEEHGSKARLPMFDVPFEVIDALDADDADSVNAAVLDFLPRALRPADESQPATGAAP